MTHKNKLTDQFSSKFETLDFSLLLHSNQIFRGAGINVGWAWPQFQGSFLQVGQKYGQYTVPDKILQTRAKNTLKRPLTGSLSVFTELSSQLQVLAVSQATPQDQFILPLQSRNICSFQTVDQNVKSKIFLLLALQ